MIDHVYDREENTIEIYSNINGGCFAVDINPKTNLRIVDDCQIVRLRLEFQVIYPIDGDVTHLTIMTQQEKCTELIYQNHLDYSKREQGSAKRILYSS